MKKLIVPMIVVMGILAGCGESTVEKVEGTGQEQEAKQEQKQKQETFKVGDTVKFDGLNVTLSKVRESKGDEFMDPQNDKFLVIQLEIENTTDKAQTVSSMLQMNLVDKEGVSMDYSITGDEKGKLDGEIGPGRKMKGEIAFDVTESEYYEFIFEDPFTTGQAIWKINKEDIK